MYKVIRVDSKGFYIEDILVGNLENLGENIIIEPCPEGFHLPKWNGKEWEEGKTKEQLDKIKEQEESLSISKKKEEERILLINEAPERIDKLNIQRCELESLIADLTEMVLMGES